MRTTNPAAEGLQGDGTIGRIMIMLSARTNLPTALLLCLPVLIATACTRPGGGETIGPVEHHRRALRMEAIGSTNVMASMAKIQRRVVMVDSTAIPIQLYTPRGDGPFPTVLLLPSIDFVAGDMVTHDRIARSIAAETPALVVLPEPGTLPESNWPTALHQLETVLDWIPDHVERWNGRTDCLVLVGEGSAGAQAAALSTRRPGDITLTILVLPVLDLRRDAWDERPWYADTMAGNDRAAEQISPLAWDIAEASPTYVITGSEDPVRDQGTEWAHRLLELQVPTTHRVLAGQGAMGMEWATVSPNVLQVVFDIAREIREICPGE